MTPTPEPPTAETVAFNVLAERLELPKPEDFPVAKDDGFSGKPAEPILSGKRSNQYRTILRERAATGPNFAGHYTIVTWGAGMGNFSIAAVDAQSGKIVFMPFESVSRAGYGLNFETGGEMNPAYRIDSTLLAFLGCPGLEYEGCSDWDKDGFYVYNFSNDRFKLIKFVRRDDYEAALKP